MIPQWILWAINLIPDATIKEQVLAFYRAFIEDSLTQIICLIAITLTGLGLWGLSIVANEIPTNWRNILIGAGANFDANAPFPEY